MNTGTLFHKDMIVSKERWDVVTLEMSGAVTGSPPRCCHLNSLEPAGFTARLCSQLCHVLIPLAPRSRAVGRARGKEQPEGTNSMSPQEQGELSGSDLKPAAGDSCRMDSSQLCPQSGGRDNRLV